MTIEFKSNKRFCTLQNKERETLKISFLNYILHENKETHYIQALNCLDFKDKLNDLLSDYLKRKADLTLCIFVNPDLFRLYKETYNFNGIEIIDSTNDMESVELF